jgi:hypothetical protein
MFPASDVNNDTNLWHKFHCETSMTALCRQETLGSFSVFPTNADVFISQTQTEEFKTSNSYLLEFATDSACNRSSTGRLLEASENKYAITLCDVLDANLDLIIKLQQTTNGDMTVYWRKDETSIWLLIFLALASIYLVSCVAQNIVAVIRNDSKHFHQDKNGLLTWRYKSQYLVTLVVILWLLQDFAFNNMFTCLVLISDKRLLIHLFVYVSVEWVWQTFVHLRKKHQFPHHEHFASTVSILTATLLIISSRIHLTFDNPYVAILTALFGVRTCYKLIWLGVHKMHYLQHVMQILDLFVFSSLLGNGIMPASATVLDGTLLQHLLVFISFLLASLLVLYKMTAAKTKIEDFASKTVPASSTSSSTVTPTSPRSPRSPTSSPRDSLPLLASSSSSLCTPSRSDSFASLSSLCSFSSQSSSS